MVISLFSIKFLDEKINDIGLLATTGGYLCLLYWWSGKCHSVIDVATKIIALLEKTKRQSDFFGNPNNPYSVIHAWYANCSAMLGNFEEAISLIEKGAHIVQAALINQVNDKLELVENFKVGYLWLIASLNQCLKASLY